MSKNDDFITLDEKVANEKEVVVEHEVLPVFTSMRDKRAFVRKQASWYNILGTRKIRGVAAGLGVISAGLVAFSLPIGTEFTGFLGTAGMVVSGLALGSLMNKKEFFGYSTSPSSFIGSAIGVVAGVAALAFGQDQNNFAMYEMLGKVTFDKTLILSSFAGGYLISKGISDFVTGLKWNKSHERFEKERVGKRKDAVENLKFDIYYEGKLATYHYVEPEEEKQARLRTAQAKKDKELADREADKARVKMLAEELRAQGFNADLSLNEDKNTKSPDKTLDAIMAEKKTEPEAPLKVAPKSKIALIKEEIDALKKDITTLSREEVSERMRKINEMKQATETKPKKTM